MVWPTISGKIVDARDQVLIMCRSPDEFIASIRPIKRSSTHGPFLEDLDISGAPFRAGVAAVARKSSRPRTQGEADGGGNLH
jgi:hypothetical protein